MALRSLKSGFASLIILLISCHSFATTPVVGTLKNLDGTVPKGAFIRARLSGCSTNQPRVNGTALFSPANGSAYYVDFAPDVNGNISGTLYSTRDAAGTGNGEIQCGDSYTAVSYAVAVWRNGGPGPESYVHAKNGVTLDLTNVTPISTNPVVTAPTGDTTYCRIDGGNCGFTGPITSTSSISAKRIESVRQFDGAGFTTEDAAITDCSTGPCLVQISPAQAQSSATSYPKNVSIFNFRTGTAATPLTNQDSGDWNISLRRHDATVNYGTVDKLLFGGPSQGGGVARFEFNAPAANVDQAFGVGSWIYCGTAPVPNSVIVTNVKVAGGFYSWRGAGAPNCGTMGINPSVSFSIDSTQADIPVEADFNNGSGVNYSINSTAASKDGVVSASGGANRGRWAFRSGNTQGVNNAWDGGMILRGWYTEGLVVKPESYSVGTIAVDSQYIGNAATSLGSQTNSGDICAMSNRWNGSAAVFDRWCQRAVPRGDGSGSHFDFINPTNGTANVQIFDSFSGQAAIFGSGVLAAQFPGSVTITNFDTTAPGLRITPLNDTAGTAIQVTNAANNANNFLLSKAGAVTALSYGTNTNCSSSASPAVCASASAGSVVIAAAATSVVVNTTAVTANSQILLTRDNSLGSKLSVTCNTQSSLVLGSPYISARSAGTSFTITIDAAPTTNPMCLSYEVKN